MTPSDLFERHVLRSDAGCWEWDGHHNEKGYPVAYPSKVNTRAYRLAYELHIGTIPEGLELDHLCRNRGCVNPWHLEPVTHSENVRRGHAGAWQRAKSHCPSGHPYDDQNTYHRNDGGRACRECNRSRAREYQRQKRVGAR